MGDLPSYDAFTLGGPYSVRGYNMGELGAARNILEVRFTGKQFLLLMNHLNSCLYGKQLFIDQKYDSLT